ncbi:MAG: DMT family transporter [Bacteroidota bacterium]
MDKFIQRLPPTLVIWTIVIVLALTWGSSFLLLKYSLQVFEPGQVFAGRMFFAALVLIPFVFRYVKDIPLKKWALLALFAFFTNFCTTYLNALAQSGITSSLNGVLSSLTPLMTLMVGYILYKASLKRSQLLALLLGLTGVVALILFEQGLKFGNFNLYAFYAVLAALCVGISTNMIRYHFSDFSPLQIASLSFLIIFPFSTGYAIYSGFFELAFASQEGWIAMQEIIFLGVISNAAAILLFAKLVEISSPIFASMVTYLMPIVAVGWGIWDGEIVTIKALAAMAIIIVSIWLVNRFSRD